MQGQSEVGTSNLPVNVIGNHAQCAAARFHATLAHAIATVAAHHEPRRVVLAGGCFQNRLLTEAALSLLERAGLPTLLPERVPTGDGGLALGQLQVAAWRQGHTWMHHSLS